MPRQSKRTSSISHRPRLGEPRRWEVWIVPLAITLTGILLRVWQPGHMAVEHFDEGVYASNILCPLSDYHYPFCHLYAPPLLPALLEWSLILTGMWSSSVMWVNVIAGCVMVPSVWWVSRQWFGPVAGLTAAMLAACSEMHILLSRTALTDGLLCLWMLWAVYWAWRAILTGRPLAILLAGLFASLAWWTKYNGWLTLAISASGTLAWIAVPRVLPARLAAHFKCAAKREDALTPGRVTLRWSLVAGIAIVGWIPVLIGLQKYGGYAAVSANHAGYFVGFDGWWPSLLRQLSNLQSIGGSLTSAGLIGAGLMLVYTGRIAATLVLREESIGQITTRLLLLIGFVTLIGFPLSLFAGITSVMAVIAIFGIVMAVLRSPSSESCLAGWLVAAWFFGLLLAIPMYTPYPRLTLPFLVSCWLAVGAATGHLYHSLPKVSASARDSQFAAWRFVLTGIPSTFLSLALTTFAIHAMLKGGTAPWQDRRGLQQIAGEMLPQIVSASDQSVVSVVGEPGLFFHLGVIKSRQLERAEDMLLVPAGDYSAASAPVPAEMAMYIVTGPHSPSLSEQPSEVRQRLSLVDEWEYRPSDFVLLDKHAPPLDPQRARSPETIRLYRVTP